MTEELLGPLAPKLDPRLVAPVAAWLVHEDCPVSGEIYSVGGGRVARFFVGLTEGYANPELTPRRSARWPSAWPDDAGCQAAISGAGVRIHRSRLRAARQR